MSTIQTLGVRDFISKYVTDQTLFDQIPEFSFIKPVAQKTKEKNCTCGLGPEIARTTLTFNDFVAELTPEIIEKVRQVFGITQVCFGLQQQDGAFHVKCY
jgi:hypothetical protein